MSESPLFAIDCFAGAGGLSLGLAQAGFAVCAAFDSNEAATRTYQRNLAHSPLIRSAKDIRGSELLSYAGVGECALVAGGPPCQGFSRQRRGSPTDERNDLVLEFIRIVVEIRPLMFLMENVSAMQSHRGQPYLGEACRRAALAGYRTRYRVLDAADFGTPQHRRRLFLVGELGDFEYFAFPKATHGPCSYVTVRAAIGDLPSPTTERGDPRALPNHELGNISELNRLRISHVPEGGGRADIPPSLRLPCHAVTVDRAGHRAVYGRLSWDLPAGTITTKCNSFTRGRFAHPLENRNISMREAARLQGFPDDFVFLGDRVAVAHQIGNAVPPPLAKNLGLALISALHKRLARRPTNQPGVQLSLAM